MFMKWEERLLYFCRILLSRQAGFCRSGDTTFLCQRVSTTSSFTCSKPPYLTRQKILAVATFVARRSGELWWPKTCSLFLHSRHGDICCSGDILPGRISSLGRQILLLLFLFFFHWFMSWSLFSCTIGLCKT